jgi:bifunctional DNA-binding transcriptional regulator/antitoxin component of YhaV-PrlF toxin-antitoxin module
MEANRKMVKLQECKTQYTISIPKDRILETGWRKGDRLSINFDKRTGELILSRLKEGT